MPVRTLQAVNLPQRERTELSLVLPLLGTQDGTAWELTERAGADAAMVDADAPDGREAMATAREIADVVITLSATAAPAESATLHVRRPLRTETLTAALAQAMQSAPTGAADGHDPPAWRLKRWPDTETLRREWRLTRVCGALARGPETVADVATRTGLEQEALEELLAMLEGAGCVERSESVPRRASGPPDSPPRGLFERLRARFSRGSN